VRSRVSDNRTPLGGEPDRERAAASTRRQKRQRIRHLMLDCMEAVAESR
jgi:hypothetical protein